MRVGVPVGAAATTEDGTVLLGNADFEVGLGAAVVAGLATWAVMGVVVGVAATVATGRVAPVVVVPDVGVLVDIADRGGRTVGIALGAKGRTVGIFGGKPVRLEDFGIVVAIAVGVTEAIVVALGCGAAETELLVSCQASKMRTRSSQRSAALLRARPSTR